MHLTTKVIIGSFLLLLASLYFYQSIDLSQRDDVLIWGFYRAKGFAMMTDSILDYFNRPGFYRWSEEAMSNSIFAQLNTSGLNVERKDFEGVEVFLFQPHRHKPNGPAIFYIHGGGFNLLDAKLYSHLTADIARHLNMMVVSVNYRRAPEYPFPIPANDVVTAAKYFLNNAERFDVDPKRIAIMGDSAGGHLSVVVAYKLAAMGNVRLPKIIVPLCASTQLADMTYPSMRPEDRDLILPRNFIYQCGCKYVFGRLSNRDLDQCSKVFAANNHLNEETVEKVKNNVNWKNYLKGREYENIETSSFNFTPNPYMEKFSQLVLDPLFSPGSALNNSELALLPPVYLLVSSLDPLRDDSKVFAKRLSQMGRLGGYKEYDHYHISFLLSPFGSDKSRESFHAMLSFFEESNIL